MRQRVVSFHYTLTDDGGRQLGTSESGDPVTYLEGVDQIIPGLETALRTMASGEEKRVIVQPGDGYGQRDPGKIVEVPRGQLPTQEIAVGDRFQAHEQPEAVLTVTGVTESHVTLDANHPLAGMPLTFDLRVTEVRDPTQDELAHGHAHGPGGHHHH